jgi:KaiC/GvpD/RAD55 family RecA-like ATPase
MEKHRTYAPKIQTGINVVDEAWGGLYRGGSYLLYGQAWSGRSLLNLEFAYTGVREDEKSLYIFPERPRDIIIQAASIHFDLRGAVENNMVKLMRIPPTFKPNELTDEELHKAITDLVQVVAQENPDRLIIDNFSRFAQFKSFTAFQDAFIDMLERIELIDTTLLFALGEPANENAKNVIEFIARHVTGCIHIALDQDEPHSSRRLITIVPNIGHLEGAVADYWDLAETVLKNESYQLAQAEAMALAAAQAERAEREQEEEQEVEEQVFAPIPVPEPIVMDSIAEEVSPQMTSTAFTLPALSPSMPPPRRLQDLRERRIAGTQIAQTPKLQIPITPTPPPLPLETQMGLAVKKLEATVPQMPSFESIQALNIAEPEEAVRIGQADSKDYTNRAAFLSSLEAAFQHRDQTGSGHFVVIAMRMDRGEGRKVRPFDFEFILDLVTESLRGSDQLLVNHERERLLILRTNIQGEDSQSFFTELMEQMRQEAPQQAEHLLRSVSAIVVPDGKPFKTAAEFLSYAMDKP